MTSETWAPIPGFPGYEVSDAGRVRSWLPYHGQPGPRLLAAGVGKAGYRQVKLSGGDGKRYYWLVHRLVMLAFVGPLPSGMETRHLNSDSLDNRLANLAYGTSWENSQDSKRDECGRGHSYAEHGRVRSDNGRRRCVVCDRLIGKARWRRDAA